MEDMSTPVLGVITPCMTPAPNLPIQGTMVAGKTGGLKHNQGKPDYTHLSKAGLDLIAGVFEAATNKYPRDNWRKGISFRASIAAMHRHLKAFEEGEDLSEDYHLNHIAHLGADVLILLESYTYNREACDDRFKRFQANDGPEKTDVKEVD